MIGGSVGTREAVRYGVVWTGGGGGAHPGPDAMPPVMIPCTHHTGALWSSVCIMIPLCPRDNAAGGGRTVLDCDARGGGNVCLPWHMHTHKH